MSLRRIVSLSLMLSILGMLITSITLYIVPQGRIAYWSEWTQWGLGKSQWGAIHTNLGLLMLVSGSFHIYYNWRPITSYMKNKARSFRLFTPNFNVALAVFAAFIGLTVMEAPPAVWIQDLRASIEEGAAVKLGEPPYGHAEESSLAVFLRNVGMEAETARMNLELAGIEAGDSGVRILDLAQANGMTPRELYEAMKGPQEQRPTEPLPIPTKMPMGTGRLTLAAFCDQYNRDPREAAAILEQAGLEVAADTSLREIAAANGLETLNLMDILRTGFGE